MLYFMFMAPAILCTLACLAVGQRPNMIPVSVNNQESSCDMFDPGQCHPDRLGCHYIQTLNTMEEVRIVSNNTRHLARITIPDNLSISYLKRVLHSDLFYKFTWVFSVEGAEAVGEYEKISVSIDMSNPIWSGFLKESIMTSLNKFQEDITSLCGENYGVNLDFSFLDPLTPFQSDTDYREYITCAAVMLPVYFLAVARTATAFIAERSQGLLERSLVAGVLPLEILLSFIASQLITVFIQVLIVIITVFYGFGLACRGNIVYYVILVMLQGVTGLCNGFFFSALCSSATNAILMAVVNLFFSFFLDGVLWPVEMMPYSWLESLSWYLPHTAALQGMRDIALRGMGLESVTVQLGTFVSFGWTIVFFVGSWILMKIKLL